MGNTSRNLMGDYMEQVKIGKHSYNTKVYKKSIFQDDYIILNDMCTNWLKTESMLDNSENAIWKLLATLNLRSLYYGEGIERFDLLLEQDESVYIINRLYDLLLNVELVLSYETITICKGKFAHYLVNVVGLPEESVENFYTDYPYFWLIPFIQFNFNRTIGY